MEYSIRQLADLAGVSTRTLRYYDEIGLLKPGRVNDAGYRSYGEKEVGLLQQILFYRERDLGLEVIRNIIQNPDFDVANALEEHLSVLSKQQEHISMLIQTVKMTIADLKGDYHMDDKMKFEAFKKKVVEENEKTYGNESREKYGSEAVDASNKKIMGLSEADYERFQNLGKEIIRQLEEAVTEGADPKGESGKRIVLLHKDWLGFTWKEYSAQAHKGLASLYVADQRFMEYYDKNVIGCGKFLAEAVEFWAGR